VTTKLRRFWRLSFHSYVVGFTMQGVHMIRVFTQVSESLPVAPLPLSAKVTKGEIRQGYKGQALQGIQLFG
jgi:hypothetical protein